MDDSEREADDDIGYDPSDVAFIEWLGSKIFNYKTMDHYTMKALWIYWIRGDNKVELTDEESSDDEDDVAEDYEWYEALEDCELKDEALRNKATMEGFIKEDDDESPTGVQYKDIYDDQIFVQDDEEYVAVKEEEYDDLTITRKEACQAYQEIFQIMDEGWMVTRAK
ncbi:hypothetical protein Tco_1046150 [Tanacetum coccineum]